MALPSISLLVISFQLLLLLPELTNARVSSIIVFGDSSVDSGNNNYIPTVLKSNFKPYGRDFEGRQPTGRFSNGRVPTDFLSETFSLKKSVPAYLDPSYTIKDFSTGVCFASAGTGYDNVTSQILSVIPLWKELEYYKEYKNRLIEYLGQDDAEELLREALHIISVGTNDFLENYYQLPHRSSKFSVEDYQKFLTGIARNFVTQIYELGARKIALTGLPPMGCLPLERTTNIASKRECIDKYNQVAMDFNQKLQALVEALNKELSGVHVVFSNPYYILYDVIRNPNSYGFDNAATACCGTGLYEMSYLCNEHNPYTCADANKHVFWDSFHPTEKTNGILANDTFRTSLAVFQ